MPVFVAGGSRELVEKNSTDNPVEEGSVTTLEEVGSRALVESKAAEAAVAKQEQVVQSR